jgi:hypothetical protein
MEFRKIRHLVAVYRHHPSAVLAFGLILDLRKQGAVNNKGVPRQFPEQRFPEIPLNDISPNDVSPNDVLGLT